MNLEVGKRGLLCLKEVSGMQMHLLTTEYFQVKQLDQHLCC